MGVDRKGQVCFFKGLAGAGPCDGKLVRCHLIPKQLMKAECWSDRAEVRDELRARVEQLGGTMPPTQLALIWDERTWVWGCGGPMGNAGHHGMLDHSRTLQVPRHRLPPAVEEFAAEFGIVWWLEREYGAASD